MKGSVEYFSMSDDLAMRNDAPFFGNVYDAGDYIEVAEKNHHPSQLWCRRCSHDKGTV